MTSCQLINYILLSFTIAHVGCNPALLGSLSSQMDIFVYSYNGGPLDTIGSILHNPDHDVSSYEWFNGQPNRYFVLDKTFGKISFNATSPPPSGTYSLAFTVTEEDISARDRANVTVIVKELTNEDIANSGLITFIDAHDTDFVKLSSGTSKMSILQNELARLFQVSLDHIDIFLARRYFCSESNRDQVELRYSVHNLTYWRPETLNRIVLQNKKNLEQALGLKIMMVGNGEYIAERSKCRSTCVYGRSQHATSHSVTTKTHSFVGVRAFETLDECSCPSIEDQDINLSINLYGNESAWYSALPNCGDSRLEIGFTAFSGNGLLFYNGALPKSTTNVSHFISLELRDGKPRVIANFGVDTTSVQLNTSNLANSGPHVITLEWNGEGMSIHVDKYSTNGTYSGIVTLDGFRDMQNGNYSLQIGHLSFDPSNLRSLAVPTTDYFNGSITFLKFNGMYYNLGDRIIENSVATFMPTYFDVRATSSPSPQKMNVQKKAVNTRGNNTVPMSLLPATSTAFPQPLQRVHRQKTAAVRQKVDIHCSSSFPNSVVSWFKNSKQVENVNGHVLTIENVQLKDAGRYTCKTATKEEIIDLKVQVTSPPQITRQSTERNFFFRGNNCDENTDTPFLLECEAMGEPAPNYKWTKNGVEFNWKMHGDRISQKQGQGTLLFKSPRKIDGGRYQCFAYNQYGIASTNPVFLRKAELKPFGDKKVVNRTAEEGRPFKLECNAPEGWPIPEIFWVMQNSRGEVLPINSSRITVDPDGTLWFSNVTRDDVSSEFLYTCAAYSSFGQETKYGNQRALFLNHTTNDSAFHVHPPVVQYLSRADTVARRDSTVRLWCIIGGTPLPDIKWTKQGGAISGDRVKYENYGKTLKIKHVQDTDEGTYECEWTFSENGAPVVKSHSMNISLYGVPYFTVEPQIQHPELGANVEITCEADGNPDPKIEWTHNGKRIVEEGGHPRRNVSTNKIVIENVTSEDTSNYGCNASNKYGYVHKDIFINVLMPPVDADLQKSSQSWDVLVLTISLPAFAVVALVCVIVFLKYQPRPTLDADAINTFLNGDSVADDKNSAYKLPYDQGRYEIAPNAFSIDKDGSLGSGEFGWVCKGTIQIGCEEIPVAVKMANPQKIRKTTIDGLLSEIKVLAHVGKHQNITELLGANTTDIKAGKVYIFVELCTLGSLEKYLRKMRQLEDGSLVESLNGNQHNSISDRRTDYRLTGENQMATFHRTLLDQSLSADLYRWAIEICDAMSFLATRHVVHADLATRNILLGSNKEAKICDFGLARRMYNYSSYVKTHQEPLPWKWMAPESLRAHEFNEKSDVWAYGVTLWEIYSLGDTPFQGLSWDQNFSNMLARGLRLGEPIFNERDMYSVMTECWTVNPVLRPSFHEISTKYFAV